MGFQGGSQIQAGLGRADFSPIERGGQAMGNAYAGIGQSLAGGIAQATAMQKQKNEQNKAYKESIAQAKQWLDLAEKNQWMPEDQTAALKESLDDPNIPLNQRASQAIPLIEFAGESMKTGIQLQKQRAVEEQNARMMRAGFELTNRYSQKDGSIELDDLTRDKAYQQLPEHIRKDINNRVQNVNKFVDEQAEAKKEADAAEAPLRTEDIPGTTHKAIFQPDGRVSIVPKADEESDKEKSTDELYGEREQSIKTAVSKGILTDEQAVEARNAAKRELYGIPRPENINIQDLLMAELLQSMRSRGSSGDDGWGPVNPKK